MKVHFIQHEIFEAPGAYLDWAIERKHAITFNVRTSMRRLKSP